nr:hypothetical transcript [Hymenolepis microstoma]
MYNEGPSVGDTSESNRQRNRYFNLKSDNSCNEDYIYQLEYEKRKYIDQIENLQQQLDLSDRRNCELSEEITSLNILNHRLKDAADENRSLHDTIDILTQSEINLKERCRQLSSSIADCELKYSAKEQELLNLEKNLQNIAEHEAFQKEFLLVVKQRFESQNNASWKNLNSYSLELLKEQVQPYPLSFT